MSARDSISIGCSVSRTAVAVALILLVGLPARTTGASSSSAPEPDVDRAFDRMYNTDFPSAFALLDKYTHAHPMDPLGYAWRSSAYLFSELMRLGILEGEFFVDDKRIAERKKLRPDPEVKVKLLQAIADTQSHANTMLANRPGDQDALFALAISHGVIMDYTALVEKKQLSSLASTRRANNYAQQLLKVNPHFYDAYMTTGLTEYLVGSLPFYVRWFVHFDDVQGSKEQGIRNLQLVAQSGRYLKPFAKIVLAIVYVREKKPKESRALLAELSAEFPENQLFRKELAKLSLLLQGAGAQQ